MTCWVFPSSSFLALWTWGSCFSMKIWSASFFDLASPELSYVVLNPSALYFLWNTKGGNLMQHFHTMIVCSEHSFYCTLLCAFCQLLCVRKRLNSMELSNKVEIIPFAPHIQYTCLCCFYYYFYWTMRKRDRIVVYVWIILKNNALACLKENHRAFLIRARNLSEKLQFKINHA